jgi:hypothetical protein
MTPEPRTCLWCHEPEQVEGGLCVRCAKEVWPS